jgi:hypothetical protein
MQHLYLSGLSAIFGLDRNFRGVLVGTRRHQFFDADSFPNNLATAAGCSQA